jgi:hypothetical protein
MDMMILYSHFSLNEDSNETSDAIKKKAIRKYRN